MATAAAAAAPTSVEGNSEMKNVALAVGTCCFVYFYSNGYLREKAVHSMNAVSGYGGGGRVESKEQKEETTKENGGVFNILFSGVLIAICAAWVKIAGDTCPYWTEKKVFVSFCVGCMTVSLLIERTEDLLIDGGNDPSPKKGDTSEDVYLQFYVDFARVLIFAFSFAVTNEIFIPKFVGEGVNPFATDVLVSLVTSAAVSGVCYYAMETFHLVKMKPPFRLLLTGQFGCIFAGAAAVYLTMIKRGEEEGVGAEQ